MEDFPTSAQGWMASMVASLAALAAALFKRQPSRRLRAVEEDLSKGRVAFVRMESHYNDIDRRLETLEKTQDRRLETLEQGQVRLGEKLDRLIERNLG